MCVHKDNQKAARMLFVYILSFVICNGPFSIMQVLYLTPKREAPGLEFMVVVLLFLSTIINPFIYVFKNQQVKNLIVSSVGSISRAKCSNGPHYRRVRRLEQVSRPKFTKGSISTVSDTQRHATSVVFHAVTKDVISEL